MKKFLLILLVLLTGCSQNLYIRGKKMVEEGKYDRAISTFYEALKEEPENARAWREMGVAYYEMNYLDKAMEALKQANNIAPDARTNLYVGLIYEQRQDYDKAIAAYAGALKMESEENARALIRNHLDWLVSYKIQREVLDALANENKLSVEDIPDNTVAVVNFDNSQLPEDIAPIGRGLAEFTATDLAKIKKLNVVDRLKIDVITDELKLGESGYVDPATAPRMGRLIGSRRIITGSLLPVGDEELRLDGAIVNTVDKATATGSRAEGEIQKFFQVQKDFVFDLLNDLDIKPTPAERDAIEEVPTESFLAFLAYSRGLAYQSQGRFTSAEAEYKLALKQDPEFTEARVRLEQIAAAPKDISEFEGAFGSFENQVTEVGPPWMPYPGLDRMQMITLLNGGYIYDPGLFNRFGNSPEMPPRFLNEPPPTGTVIVTGDTYVD